MNKLKLLQFDYGDTTGKAKNHIDIGIGVQIRLGGVNYASRVIAKVDTGAANTIIPMSLLYIPEACKKNLIIECSKINAFQGIDDSSSFPGYEIRLNEININGLKIRGFPVNITTSKDVNRALLGMDFLRMFYMYINPLRQELGLRETPELARYTHADLWLDAEINTHRAESIELDTIDLEANYINQLIDRLGENNE